MTLRFLESPEEIANALDVASQDLQVDEAELESGDLDGAQEISSETANETMQDDLELEVLPIEKGRTTGPLKQTTLNMLLKSTTSTKKSPKRLLTSGRPRDPVRDEFSKVDSGKAQCKRCNNKITDRVDIMKGHLRCCRGGSNHSSVEKPKEDEKRSQCNNPAASVPTSASVPAGTQRRDASKVPSVVPSNSKMKSFLDTLTPSQQRELDFKVAKFIYACNVPFAVVENPEFQDLITTLRPAYENRIPNERRIANELLDEVYSAKKDDFTKTVFEKDVVMVQDGWSTKQNQPVIAHSVQVGTKNLFYNAICTGTFSKSSEWLATLLFDTIDECEMKHGCKVVGVVTDNCSTMTALREIVERQRPGIFVYGCNAHYINNVGVKISPPDKLKDIVDIQKYFKNHHFPSAVLEESITGKRPVIPCTTRWNSQKDCIENFLDNHAIYLDTVRKHPSKFDPVTANLIKDSSVYERALKWKILAEPFADSLDLMQSNSFTLSQAVKEWISLHQKVSNELRIEDKAAKDCFYEKYKEALSPVALSSYLLDPRYRGKDMTATQMSAALEWLRRINTGLVVMAIELQAKNCERFPSYLMDEETLKSVDPKSFWISVKNHHCFDEECCEVARKLQLLPASASGIERCFSTMGSILNSRRSRLGVDKASKLCTIYQSLRFMKAEPMPEYE